MALTDFGRRVKTRLIELDHNQVWLIEQVKAKTGLYFDRSYMRKILCGELKTPKILTAIREILELEDSAA